MPYYCHVESNEARHKTTTMNSKYIITENFEGNQLTVLVEEKEDGKGFVDYFIGMTCVTEWGVLNESTKKKLSIMADVLCKMNDLKKWSY